MMPLRPLVLVGLPRTSTLPYSEPLLVRRSIRKLSGTLAPAAMRNERRFART